MATRQLTITAAAAVLAAVSGAVVIAHTAAAVSENYVVDTLSDDTDDGLTLRDAIEASNANAAFPNSVTFEAGLTGEITLTGGALDVTNTVLVSGPGSAHLTIDAGDSTRAFESDTGGISFDLTGATIIGGISGTNGGALQFIGPTSVGLDDVVVTNSAAVNDGGAMYVEDAHQVVTISRSRFEANLTGADGDGGAVFISADDEVMRAITITDTEFVGNRAGGSGGGVFIEAAGQPVSMTGSTFTDNNAADGDGGGLRVNASQFDGADLAFNGNIADTGGGFDVVADTSVNIDDLVVSDNTGRIGNGGGSINAGGALHLSEAVVSDNSSGTTGGLAASSNESTTITSSRFEGNEGLSAGGLSLTGITSTVRDSTFVDNVSSSGGGLGAISTTVFVERSTFSGNAANPDVDGGGAISGFFSDVTIDSSTLSGNSGANGGAILILGDLTVRYSTIVSNTATTTGGGIAFRDGLDTDATLERTVLADNTAPMSPDIDSAEVTANFSLIESPFATTLNGSDNITGEEPLLGPLADNGGTTRTHLPMPASPVIDAGGSPVVDVPATDQRGQARPVGPMDIGAVEVAPDPDPDPDPATSIWSPVEPARIVDTRAAGDTIDDIDQGAGKVGADTQERYTVGGRAGVPADAKAVIAYVTAVRPDATGFMTVHPCAEPRPLAASLNYTSGVNLGNELIIGLNDGDICLYTFAESHVTIDVVGYVPADSMYQPAEPVRLLDTRATGATFDGQQQRDGRPGAGSLTEVTVTGRAGADDATNVVLYVTAVGPARTGFVTVWNCTGDQPNASSLNYVAGVNRGNEIVAGLSDDGKVCIFTDDAIHLTVDLVGSFGDSNYTSLESPTRVLDTRAAGETVDSRFQADGALSAGATLTLDVGGRPGVDADAETITINITVVRPVALGFLTVFPCGDQPNAASLNYVAGVSGGNEIVASLNNAGQICIFTSEQTQLTADVTGWTSH